MNMNKALVRSGLALLLAFAGCASLNLRSYNASVSKPSNVALYFQVIDRGGSPVPLLTKENFHIYEDGALVSEYESKQTILNPEVAAVHYTLLLVDLSGSVTQSGSLQQLQPAVQSFADRVGQMNQVGIYAFDGSPSIVPVVGFGAAASGISGAAERLGATRTRDPSTNLYGAVVEGLRVLDKAMTQGRAPLKFGTLVVFTDGTDRAHRVDRKELDEALKGARVNLFVIGVGNEIDDRELRNIGRTGAFLSREPTQLAAAFDHIAQQVEAYTKSFYLLSYCSPSRAREHLLRVVASDAQRRSGTLEFQFSAEGFGPNCDSNRLPRFDIHRPTVPAK